MAIKKANELDFSNKKVAMLICGAPGVGKSTIALSAPKPLLIDIDEGIDRVEACYRDDTLTYDPDLSGIEKWNIINNDLKNEDLSPYETIVIDTLGKLVDILTPVVIKENAVNGQKDGRTLSLKGYGAVGAKIRDFIKFIHSLGKHVVFISHVTEIQDGETTKVRLNITGSTKDNIWKDIDLGGYVEIVGKKRIINFTPNERYYAKGTHGITGSYEIPTLKSTNEGGRNQDNNFLTKLFEVYVADIQNTQKKYTDDKAIYDEAIKLAKVVNDSKTVEELNKAVDKIKETKHALSSREELLVHVGNKARELGAVYDKESKCYVTTTKDNAEV